MHVQRNVGFLFFAIACVPVLGSTDFPIEKVMWTFSWDLAVILTAPPHPMWRLIRQALYCNVQLRGVRITIVAGAKQLVLHILSVRLYSCLSNPL
jgi:hypothetical protein